MSVCRLFLLIVLAFSLLVPAISATIVWGPYVTNTSTSSATIAWKATEDAVGWVEYSSESSGTRCVQSTVEMNGVHRVHLTGLLPATTYHYLIGTGDEIVEDCRFRTFGDTTFTYIVYGDTQGQIPFFTQADRHSLVMERMAEEKDVLFLIHTGDFVGDRSEWDEFFAIARPILKNTTLVPVTGNHDGPIEVFSSIFDLPAYYSFDAGSIHATILDSNDRAWADMKTQTAWLKEDLASSLPWKIVAFHHPPFSSDQKHPGGDLAIRSEWSNILSQNNVDAVFGGHTHAYERYRVGGTEYFVTGCGGGLFYPLAEEKPEGHKTSCERVLGYVRANVSPNSIDVEMVAVARVTDEGGVMMYPVGTIVDTVHLPANTSSPESVAAGWWCAPAALVGVMMIFRLR